MRKFVIFSQQARKLNAWKEENEANKRVKEANEEKIKKDEIKLAKYDGFCALF
jgi:hypothetical protein